MGALLASFPGHAYFGILAQVVEFILVTRLPKDPLKLGFH